MFIEFRIVRLVYLVYILGKLFWGLKISNRSTLVIYEHVYELYFSWLRNKGVDDLVVYRLVFSRFFFIFSEISEILKKNRLQKLVFPVKWSVWLYASTLQNFARCYSFDVNGFHEKEMLKRGRICEKFLKRTHELKVAA